jgi:hypothetical protein
VPASRPQSRRHKYMIPITKMRQKTSARPSCDAIFPDFSREFDRRFAALAHQNGRFGHRRSEFHVDLCSISARAVERRIFKSAPRPGTADLKPCHPACSWLSRGCNPHCWAAAVRPTRWPSRLLPSTTPSFARIGARPTTPSPAPAGIGLPCPLTFAAAADPQSWIRTRSAGSANGLGPTSTA